MNDERKPAALDGATIKRGLVAGLLAWLLPGAGHLFLGARQRALVFFAIVAGCFAMGVICDGNVAVVDNLRAPVLSRLQVLSDLAVGPADPLLRWLAYGQVVYVDPQPGNTRVPLPKALELRRERSFRTYSAYGSAYLLTAGLMNILLIFDAWDLAIGRKS